MTTQPDLPALSLRPSLLPLPAPDLHLESPPRRGDLCPQCGAGKLDYNGLLELACEGCGFAFSGGAGCT